MDFGRYSGILKNGTKLFVTTSISLVLSSGCVPSNDGISETSTQSNEIASLIASSSYLQSSGVMMSSSGTFSSGPESGSSDDTNFERPNILFIITDEQRADSVGGYGKDWVRTPNLDKLSSDGVLFRNHFVNSPQCVPSRTSMLSGVYPHQTGVFQNGQEKEDWPEGFISFPEVFSENNYTTANLGKIHYPKNEDMWDENNVFVEFPQVATPFKLGSGYSESEYEVIHRYEGSTISSGRYPDYNNGTTPTTHLTDMAVSWIDDHKADDDPFLLRVSYVAPHTPVLAPEPFYSMFEPDDMDCDWWPDAQKEKLTVYDNFFAKINAGDQFDITIEKLQRIHATYNGLVSHVDDQIGRLIKKLEEDGLMENTIIVFTSDHGSMLGEHTQFEKGMFYDQSVRVPLIVYWKNKLPGGKVVTGLTEHVDIAPTLLNLARIDVPEHYAGKPLLKDPYNITGKEYIFGERALAKKDKGPKRVWIRSDRYTLNYSMYNSLGIFALNDERDGFLADLEKDPGETKNLYNDPQYAEIKKELERKIYEWMNP